ncbi:MAG: GHKL domain-containing protein [Lachnospira eligens]
MTTELGINDIHLCSIFNNLCNNAVKANEFVDRDRFITVNCSLKGNYMHVSVENAFDPDTNGKSVKAMECLY